MKVQLHHFSYFTCDATPQCGQTSTAEPQPLTARKTAKQAGWNLNAFGRAGFDLCPRHAKDVYQALIER